MSWTSVAAQSWVAPRRNSAQDHFQGAPTEAIKATNVAIAPAARTDVCVILFIAHSILMALRL
jgi:hypothetical protein